ARARDQARFGGCRGAVPKANICSHGGQASTGAPTRSAGCSEEGSDRVLGANSGRGGGAEPPSASARTPWVWLAWGRVGSNPQPRHCHAQAPRAGAALTDLGHRAPPVALQVGAPLPERERVVLAQALLVADLQPVIVHRADHRARALQLAVGKDVTVDERAGTV